MPTRLAPGLDGPERWCWTHGTLTETRAPTAEDEANRRRLAKQDNVIPGLACGTTGRTRPRTPRRPQAVVADRVPDDALRRCRRCDLETRTVELVRLREERARIHEAIRKYGGAVTLVDSDDSEEVTLVYRRDRGADEFVAGGFMNLLGATRGTERRTRADLVDLLDLAVKAYPERAEIAGILGDTLPLSPA